MRFNVIGLSALLAATATALPVAIPDVQTVQNVVWETVYETVYQTATPTSEVALSEPTAPLAVENFAVPSASSTETPTVAPATTAVPTTSVPTLNVPSTTSAPAVVPTPTNVASTSTLVPSTSSSAPSATGSGLSIQNNLDETVYLWVVTETQGEMQTLKSGETFDGHTWLTNSNGGGISIKMSTSELCDSVLQFEYTQSGNVLFWDLSSINLIKTSSFVTAGFGVTISDSSCKSATCAAGDANCIESYQHPDDVNTLACTVDAAYTLTLG
ncbi:unnamed protein product [Penicillium salamii]|uniref:Antigenic thaumatin-like protein n=1 Tax=Penicillium salamii TaxID=1612424 RepID=A0A9W4N188_9EURO|nr:unnamed protein product [Penicillium salamii]CAG8251278.1 unnamed protein product [Penicillium salamii]CAG8266772.1 unnamed protein product [Penicillium salamii]CAG8340871.1 unnamed protein product [Penicillium salamii]CAG8377024.1 unnamed protein product [Penicillium salamii]